MNDNDQGSSKDLTPTIMLIFFAVLNVLLVLSALVAFRLGGSERLFSLALIQTLTALPLLVGEYLYLYCLPEPQFLTLVQCSETIFSLIWCSMALHLGRAARGMTGYSSLSGRAVALTIPVLSLAAVFFLTGGFGLDRVESGFVFTLYSPAYFSAFIMLLVVLYASWRLEHFWSGLKSAQRWEYKTLVTGNLVLCGTFAWIASYRLTYLVIIPDHFLLSALLLLLGWIMILYAVLHHRLLNRKFFVSRKIVSSFAVPSLLAAYLVVFGLITLLMRTFGLEMAFVVQWMLVASGIIAAIVFAFSGKIRRRIHFYISTHFYVNKYEYRDEWLALSEELQGAMSEQEVVNALHQVLSKSLYTTRIHIWLGDPDRGYTLFFTPFELEESGGKNTIDADNPLIPYLLSHSYFDLEDKDRDSAWRKVFQWNNRLLATLRLKLITPIAAGSQLVGLIGLGPEYTGGQYGHDDFDLLTVLGRQTASALLAVRMAEELAHAREQRAWNRLSAFVLHDIKNAATMLSMLRENAPEHIHEPEFQQDMLELVDDALRRMGRVEQRLLTLKDEITPRLEKTALCSSLQTFCRRMRAKLTGVNIELHCTKELLVKTDPDILFSILENLLLNSFQAGGKSICLTVETDSDGKEIAMEIADNGSGIAEDLLPDALFEPFKTGKKGGSGIGLWQVQRMVVSLGGGISAANRSAGGARFTLTLPSDTLSAR